MKNEIWLSVKETAKLCNADRRTVLRNIDLYQSKTVIAAGGRQYRILLASLPIEAQVRYFDAAALQRPNKDPEPFDLASLPEYNQQLWKERKTIMRASEGFTGKDLKQWVKAWNDEHPEMQTSVSRIYEYRRLYKLYGDNGLAGRYGNRSGDTVVPDDLFEIYKAKYLDENKRSHEHCYQIIQGIAAQQNRDIPSLGAFKYRLNREVPQSVQDLKREGYQYWNRKWNNYIERDYSDIGAGEFWVSDHHQLDAAVRLDNGKVVFPWITAWRCLKTGKWLGWCLHPEAPNTDHILQAFYNAAIKFGIPYGILIDNGKDYRARTFAGGRQNHRVEVNENQVRSLTAMLNIEVKFATPYGAQSKPIERDFRIIKERFCRGFDCYRAGNTLERPESFSEVYASGQAVDWKTYLSLFNRFVEDVLNNLESEGKVHQGKSRNQVWAEELSEHNPLRKVMPDDLKLFCMRASGDLSVGRNGICYSRKLGMYYYATWMEGWKDSKKKVYIRRDPNRYEEAWVFCADTNEYIGKAYLNVWNAKVWAEGVHKEDLQRLIEQKRAVEKIARMLGTANPDILTDAAEDIALMSKAIEASRKDKPLPTPKESRTYILTKISEAVRREKLRTGTDDADELKPINKNAKDEFEGWI